MFECSAIAHKYSYAFASNISIAHPVLTIPYVWRVTHEYINEGLKQGLKFFLKFSCQSLGYKQSKDIIL